MTIRCDICGEEVNHLRTATFLIIGLNGGGMSIGMLTDNIVFSLLGVLFGLVLAISILYNFNPKHWKHVFKREVI